MATDAPAPPDLGAGVDPFWSRPACLSLPYLGAEESVVEFRIGPDGKAVVTRVIPPEAVSPTEPVDNSNQRLKESRPNTGQEPQAITSGCEPDQDPDLVAVTRVASSPEDIEAHVRAVLDGRNGPARGGKRLVLADMGGRQDCRDEADFKVAILLIQACHRSGSRIVLGVTGDGWPVLHAWPIRQEVPATFRLQHPWRSFVGREPDDDYKIEERLSGKHGSMSYAGVAKVPEGQTRSLAVHDETRAISPEVLEKMASRRERAGRSLIEEAAAMKSRLLAELKADKPLWSGSDRLDSMMYALQALPPDPDRSRTGFVDYARLPGWRSLRLGPARDRERLLRWMRDDVLSHVMVHLDTTSPDGRDETLGYCLDDRELRGHREPETLARLLVHEFRGRLTAGQAGRLLADIHPAWADRLLSREHGWWAAYAEGYDDGAAAQDRPSRRDERHRVARVLEAAARATRPPSEVSRLALAADGLRRHDDRNGPVDHALDTLTGLDDPRFRRAPRGRARG